MISIQVSVPDLEQFKADVGKATGAYESLLRQAMSKSTSKIKNEIRATIVAKGISNTGQLLASVYNLVESPYRGIVATGEKYGIFVEKGTGPHFPPVAPLERWAHLKLGAPAGAGFAIARKISKKGTKAQPFFFDTLADNLSEITYFFDQANLQFVKLLGR